MGLVGTSAGALIRRLTPVDDNYSPEPEAGEERYGNGGNGGSGMGHRMTALENRMGSVENRMSTLETRIGTVENRLTAVEVRMEGLVTKEDLEKVKNSIWLAASVTVSFVIVIMSFMVAIIKFL